ncbi:MAG: hypothetical protein E6017_21785 [Kluyvera cryocrescens]|nr:hypothetical protein [Kluyvera cryocrescens]MCX2869514.1 hypothetical protein [Kluyvera cryocrescens]MDU5688231.1 hypothetical protein [Kluyvera cryocrescens]
MDTYLPEPRQGKPILSLMVLQKQQCQTFALMAKANHELKGQKQKNHP